MRYLIAFLLSLWLVSDLAGPIYHWGLCNNVVAPGIAECGFEAKAKVVEVEERVPEVQGDSMYIVAGTSIYSSGHTVSSAAFSAGFAIYAY